MPPSTSIANIRFLPALSKVVFQTDFPQDDERILRRTHLRFFTRKSSVQLRETRGFAIQRIKRVNAY